MRVERGVRLETVVGVVPELSQALGTSKDSPMLTLPPETVKVAPCPIPYSANASHSRQSSDEGAAWRTPLRISR